VVIARNLPIRLKRAYVSEPDRLPDQVDVDTAGQFLVYF
jgi:hypothetical protein